MLAGFHLVEILLIASLIELGLGSAVGLNDDFAILDINPES